MRLVGSEHLMGDRGATETLRQRARASRIRATQATLISLLYLIPSLVVFGVFVFFPLFKSIYLSLFASDPFGRGNGIFVGMKQYGIALNSPT